MFFTTNENPQMVLSFVDYRRFGRWEVSSSYGKDRGADPMWDYPSFREKIMNNLDAPVFKRPICEAMLDQKYFNGIGNYLRAEILFRCGVRPFERASDVLGELKPFSKWYQENEKGEDKISEVKPDLLDQCHILPKEVINLGDGKGYNVGINSKDEYRKFQDWLQCYYVDGMTNMADHNKRTIWFTGEPGPLVPKVIKERKKVVRSKANKRTSEDDDPSINEEGTKKAIKKLKEKKQNHNKKASVIKTGKKQSDTIENADIKREMSKKLLQQKDVKKDVTWRDGIIKTEVIKKNCVPQQTNKQVLKRKSQKVHEKPKENLILEKEKSKIQKDENSEKRNKRSSRISSMIVVRHNYT